MSKLSRWNPRVTILCVGIAIGVAALALAQTARAPIPNFAPDDRTSWYPDRLDGDNWLPPEGGGPGPILSTPDHPYVPNDASDQPTYRIADLSNPILQPWVREQMKRDNDEVLAGKIPFMARERCYPPGMAWNVFRRVTPPMVFFVQQPTFVLLMYRGDNQFRHVYLNVPHSAHPKPSWNGESVGHYENGDTLVVDTIGVLVHRYNFVDNYRTPHTDQLHVVERYRLSADGKTIDVNVRFEDPGAFTTPWEARQHYAKSEEGPLEETICAESAGRGTDLFNWGLTHAAELAPMPQDDTPDF
ncbi:MAG TPA: hypothetical protein VL693_07415 [Vicinamibacterales bacterium]|jgi:hypothetical protein|nr:hypothetical protein [Vicinamibacterales bacterium]